jgi:hypothetical protein
MKWIEYDTATGKAKEVYEIPPGLRRKVEWMERFLDPRKPVKVGNAIKYWWARVQLWRFQRYVGKWDPELRDEFVKLLKDLRERIAWYADIKAKWGGFHPSQSQEFIELMTWAAKHARKPDERRGQQ